MESKHKNKKIKEEEGLEENKNHSDNVYTTGAVSGSAAVSATDFAFLMQANKKHKGGSKSTNYKEAKKANIRRNEKNEREFQKVMNKQLQEEIEREEREWAVTDKDDIKFQKKQEEKMRKKSPSNKEVNSQVFEEEEKIMSKKKDTKNGWGKKKN